MTKKKEETEEVVYEPTNTGSFHDAFGNIIDVANDPDAQRKLAEAKAAKEQQAE